jgi:hypothetical protein
VSRDSELVAEWCTSVDRKWGVCTGTITGMLVGFYKPEVRDLNLHRFENLKSRCSHHDHHQSVRKTLHDFRRWGVWRNTKTIGMIEQLNMLNDAKYNTRWRIGFRRSEISNEKVAITVVSKVRSSHIVIKRALLCVHSGRKVRVLPSGEVGELQSIQPAVILRYWLLITRSCAKIYIFIHSTGKCCVHK